MKRITASIILVFVFVIVVFVQEGKSKIAADSPFDSFGKISLNHMKGRLDNFFIALKRDMEMKGFVILELNKKESEAKKIKRLKEISKHISDRKFDRRRLEFAIIQSDREWTILQPVSINYSFEDFLSPQKGENYQIIKGEDFDQKIKELFPKK